MESEFAGPRALSIARHKSAAGLRILALIIPVLSLLAAAVGATFQFWFYVLAAFLSRYLWVVSNEKQAASNRAAQGANGEDEVALVLNQLPQGWSYTRNVMAHGIGDIDLVVTSPTKQYFAIDVKSHAGIVTCKDGVLLRQITGTERLFEKDILNQCMKQALVLRENANLPFVHGVIVFSQARLSISDRKQRGVHLIQKDELLNFLENVERTSALSARKSPPKILLRVVEPSRMMEALRTCDADCPVGQEDAIAELKELLTRFNYADLGSAYKLKAHNCWKCKVRIPVLTWTGHEEWGSNRPPSPVPHSVKWSFSSSTDRHYWANTCPSCHAIQGDFFVHKQNTSPWIASDTLKWIDLTEA